MLLKKNGAGEYEPWDPLDTPASPATTCARSYRNLDVMTTLIRLHAGAGLGSLCQRSRRRQLPVRDQLARTPMRMTTADRHTFFKWMVRTVAEQHGLWATFMPKPFAHLTGNGAHYHLSLADANSGQNLFLDESRPNWGSRSSRRWFMGGLLHHAAGCRPYWRRWSTATSG